MSADSRDWPLLAGMGSGAEKGLDAAGIRTYDEALAACAEIGSTNAASGAKYGVDDLVCFLCLSQHAEAHLQDDAPDVPQPAPPVCVSEDLGLALPQSAVIARRILVKTFARLPIVSIMASVLLELLCWLPIAEAQTLSRCSNVLHARGLHLATRIAQSSRNIADSVASLLSVGAPTGASMLQAGVSKGALLRLVGGAWDWLEKCRWVGADKHLMSLALVRLSAKYNLDDEQCNIALKLFGTAEEKPKLAQYECRLIAELWGRGEPYV